MDNTPYSIFLFFIDFNAVILHVYKRGFCEKLVGEYSHIIPYLHTWITEIVAVGKLLSVNSFQKIGNRGVVVYTFFYNGIEISKTPSRP